MPTSFDHWSGRQPCLSALNTKSNNEIMPSMADISKNAAVSRHAVSCLDLSESPTLNEKSQLIFADAGDFIQPRIAPRMPQEADHCRRRGGIAAIPTMLRSRPPGRQMTLIFGIDSVARAPRHRAASRWLCRHAIRRQTPIAARRLRPPYVEELPHYAAG